MEILQIICSLLHETPEWAFLYLVPALIVFSAILFIFLKRRRWFYLIALVSSAAGAAVVFVQNAPFTVVYVCLLVALTGICSLFFSLICLIPQRRKKRDKGKVQEERMYEKFREELSEQPYVLHGKMPPKVCCFEEKSFEENDMRLSYAESLIKKLRAQKLNAGDRLETEELSRRLDGYKRNVLSPEEKELLNDCLASVLKLTAKYNL